MWELFNSQFQSCGGNSCDKDAVLHGYHGEGVTYSEEVALTEEAPQKSHRRSFISRTVYEEDAFQRLACSTPPQAL